MKDNLLNFDLIDQFVKTWCKMIKILISFDFFNFSKINRLVWEESG